MIKLKPIPHLDAMPTRISMHEGLSWNHDQRSWELSTTENGKRVSLGFFISEKEAIESPEYKVFKNKPEPFPELTENALAVLNKRYFKRDEQGKVIENWEQLCDRVSKTLADQEQHPSDKEIWKGKYKDLMVNLDFLPNSPALRHFGVNPKGCGSACFVLPIEDSRRSIFGTLADAVDVQAHGGGCIKEGSLVPTSNGVKKIENVAVGDKVHTLNEKTKEFGLSEVTKTHQYSPEGKNILKVDLQGHTSLVLTDYHPFLVLTENGIEQKRADELKRRDLVISGSHEYNWTFDEFYWMLGFIVSDGGFDNNVNGARLRVSKGYEEPIKRIAKQLGMKYGLSSNKRYKSKVWEVTLQGKRVERLFDEHFKYSNGKWKTSYTVRIPKKVWSASYGQKLSFMAGLMDGDSSWNGEKYQVDHVTVSRNLHIELLHLTASLGIYTRYRIRYDVRENEQVTYELQIPIYSGNTNEILKYTARMNKHYNACVNLTRRALKFPYQRFKHIIGVYARDTRTPTLIGYRSVALSHWYNTNMMSKETLFYLLGYLDSNEPVWNLWKKYAPGAREVEKVTPFSDCDLYDLTVKDGATYMASSVGAPVIIHNTGLSFSKLRPKGFAVHSTGGRASGPISFMDSYDKVIGDTISQGGVRHGANMGVLHVDHPDIEEFIKCKNVEGKFTHFNISVGITDKFMEAVEKDEDFDLTWDGEVVKTVKARELWDMIVKSAHQSADPGLLFLDTVNRTNPIKFMGNIDATNPCLAGSSIVEVILNNEVCIAKVEDLVNKPISDIKLKDKFYPCTSFFSKGVKPVYRLYTEEGEVIDLTGDHKLQNSKGNFVEVSSLKRGDELNIFADKKSYSDSEELDITDLDLAYLDLAYLVGLVMGDGFLGVDRAGIQVGYGSKPISKDMQAFCDLIQKKIYNVFQPKSASWLELGNRCQRQISSVGLRRYLIQELKMVQKHKKITIELESKSLQFLSRFLSGFFDTDGSIQGTTKKGVSVRLSQSDLEMLRVVQRILLRFGIYSTIYLRREEHKKWIRDIFCNIKTQYELCISGESLFRFHDSIGFKHPTKRRRIKKELNTFRRGPNRDKDTVRFDSLQFLGNREVFDIQVKDVNSYSVHGFISHNCGEQPLLPYQTCVLGSINLSNHVKGDWLSEPVSLDLDKLGDTVKTAVRLLDSIIDSNWYPVKKIGEVTKDTRNIGLGIMGLADLFIKMHLVYGSDESLKVASSLMKFINKEAYTESLELAKSKAPAPCLLKEYPSDPSLHRRNGALTTIAPTGTLSLIANCSSGCEPVFSASYEKLCLEGSLTVQHPLWKEYADFNNSEKYPDYFITAMEIPFKEHIKMQAALQKHIDAAVSKTINLCSSATIQDVDQAYKMAYKMECKGITVYRNGSKKMQAQTGSDEVIPEKVTRLPIDEILDGKTIRIPFQKRWYLTLNYSNDVPIELFINAGKSGSDEKSWTEATGRLVSLYLQSGGDIEKVVKTLRNIHGKEVKFHKGWILQSGPDAVAKAIQKILGEKSEPVESGPTQKCPICGKNTLVNLEGCESCLNPGCDLFGKCG